MDFCRRRAGGGWRWLRTGNARPARANSHALGPRDVAGSLADLLDLPSARDGEQREDRGAGDEGDAGGHSPHGAHSPAGHTLFSHAGRPFTCASTLPGSPAPSR